MFHSINKYNTSQNNIPQQTGWSVSPYDPLGLVHLCWTFRGVLHTQTGPHACTAALCQLNHFSRPSILILLEVQIAIAEDPSLDPSIHIKTSDRLSVALFDLESGTGGICLGALELT